MQLAGNLAEVRECCAQWRLKSKSNYALHELGNSIGGDACRRLRVNLRRRGRLSVALEVGLRGRRGFRLRFYRRSGNLLVFVYGEQQVVTKMMAPVNPATAQIEE
jgi:hypothetical protein